MNINLSFFNRFPFLKRLGQTLLFVFVLVLLSILPKHPYLSMGVRFLCVAVSVVLIYFIFKKLKNISPSVQDKKDKRSGKIILKSIFFALFILLSVGIRAEDADIEKLYCQQPKELWEAGVSQQGCFICRITETFLEGLGKLTEKIDEDMRAMALDLLLVMFLFWIVVKVGSLFFNIFAGGVADFTTDFVRRFFLVMIAAIFLLSPLTDFFSWVITPIAQMASGFTTEIIKASNKRPTNDPTLAESYVKDLNCCYCNNSCQRNKDTLKGLLDEETLDSMLCMTCLTYKQVLPLIVSGQAISCYGYEKKQWGRWFVGWGLVLVFTFIIMAVAFHVMDIFFKIAIVFVLMPFFIAAYPFPSTRFYVKKAFDLLLFCFLQFLGLGLMLAVLCAIFLTILPQGANVPGSMENLVSAIKSNQIEKIYSFFAMGEEGSALSVLRTLFTCLVTGIIAQKLISSSESLISTLTGMFVPSTQLGSEVMMEIRNATVVITSGLSHVIQQAVSRGADVATFITKMAGSTLATPFLSIPVKLAGFTAQAAAGATEALPLLTTAAMPSMLFHYFTNQVGMPSVPPSSPVAPGGPPDPADPKAGAGSVVGKGDIGGDPDTVTEPDPSKDPVPKGKAGASVAPSTDPDSKKAGVTAPKRKTTTPSPGGPKGPVAGDPSSSLGAVPPSPTASSVPTGAAAPSTTATASTTPSVPASGDAGASLPSSGTAAPSTTATPSPAATASTTPSVPGSGVAGAPSSSSGTVAPSSTATASTTPSVPGSGVARAPSSPSGTTAPSPTATASATPSVPTGGDSTGPLPFSAPGGTFASLDAHPTGNQLNNAGYVTGSAPQNSMPNYSNSNDLITKTANASTLAQTELSRSVNGKSPVNNGKMSLVPGKNPSQLKPYDPSQMENMTFIG